MAQGGLAKETVKAVYGLDKQATEILYVANAKSALRVRETTSVDAKVLGRIRKGDSVSIASLSSAWAKVRYQEGYGYVQSAYLTKLRLWDARTGKAGAQVSFEEPIGEIESANGFLRNYVGYVMNGAKLYQEPDEKSASKPLKRSTKLYISAFRGDGWAFCEVNDQAGYVSCDKLFRVDKLDPWAEDATGARHFSYLALTAGEAAITDAKGELLQRLPLRASVCGNLTEDGRLEVPHMRTMGYIAPSDIVEMIAVVDWREAKSGELIAVMTTYYEPLEELPKATDAPAPTDTLAPVDGSMAMDISGEATLSPQEAKELHKLEQERELSRGRAYNIALSAKMLDGLLIAKGQRISVNGLIGPYDAQTGYQLAKIIGGSSATGHGGGVCQTSTTLYNALVQLPIYFRERNVHSYAGVEYVPQGWDSALANRGSIDLIFENVLEYPIRLAMITGNGFETVCVFCAESLAES